MPRAIGASVAVVLLAAALALAQKKYSGPKCLGPFCINRATTTARLFKQLGDPQKKTDPYCFKSETENAFLYIVTIHTQAGEVGDVFLSDFPNCMHIATQMTRDDLRAWKTREGIGLGSSEADVIKAYGMPPHRDRIVRSAENPSLKGVVTEHFIYRLRIRGYDGGAKGPSVGDKRLFYNSRDYEDLSAAEFGIRKGVVSYIWLSYNE